MKNANFTEKDLAVIKEIAIRLYLDSDPDGKSPEKYNFQVTAEATMIFLKRTDRLKDET
jgi:hypothetical protein